MGVLRRTCTDRKVSATDVVASERRTGIFLPTGTRYGSNFYGSGKTRQNICLVVFSVS